MKRPDPLPLPNYAYVAQARKEPGEAHVRRLVYPGLREFPRKTTTPTLCGALAAAEGFDIRVIKGELDLAPHMCRVCMNEYAYETGTDPDTPRSWIAYGRQKRVGDDRVAWTNVYQSQRVAELNSIGDDPVYRLRFTEAPSAIPDAEVHWAAEDPEGRISFIWHSWVHFCCCFHSDIREAVRKSGYRVVRLLAIPEPEEV